MLFDGGNYHLVILRTKLGFGNLNTFLSILFYPYFGNGTHVPCAFLEHMYMATVIIDI